MHGPDLLKSHLRLILCMLAFTIQPLLCICGFSVPTYVYKWPIKLCMYVCSFVHHQLRVYTYVRMFICIFHVSFLINVELPFLMAFLMELLTYLVTFLVALGAKGVQLNTTQCNTNELWIYQMLALTKLCLKHCKVILFHSEVMK